MFTLILIIIAVLLLIGLFEDNTYIQIYSHQKDMLDKEIWDMERHNELMDVREALVKEQQVSNLINYSNLIYLEHIVKKLNEMPSKNKALCKQALLYVKMAKDGFVPMGDV